MPKKNEHKPLEFKQLKWACRRGMLELDVLLNNFLEKGYSQATLQEQMIFAQLLDYPDPILFSWLVGQTEPTDPNIKHLIELIRQHGKQSI